MKNMFRMRRLATAATLTLATVLATSACGAVAVPSAEGDKGAPSAGAQGLAGLLPAGIRDKGFVVVGTDPTYPPFEVLSDDQKTIEGLDPDLIHAMASKLGITVKFQQAGFDSIVPGLQAQRYDLAMSAMTDTVERQEKVTFVDYFEVGGGVLMKADDPALKGPMPDVLCGKEVAVGVGTIIAKISAKSSQACIDAGKAPIDLKNYPSVSAAVLALDSGRIGYVWTDSVSAATQAKKSDGVLASLPDGTGSNPSGMAFPKDSEELIGAFQAALQSMMDDGSYVEILDGYGLKDGALSKATINAGKG